MDLDSALWVLEREQSRVRVSKFLRERERQKSPASSLGRPAVYLEILGFSINDLRERQP